jgi:beta-glucosidase
VRGKYSRWYAAIALLGSVLVAGVFAQAPQRQQAPKGPWMDKSLPPDQRADLVVKEMTLDEKLSILHGRGGFQAEGAISNGGAGVVQGVPRLGLPPIQLADSAVGVRAAAERGRYATLLPSTVALAAAWDSSLAFEYGEVIGRELRDQQYQASLGAGVNLMREPRNGRNFEYAGEDPVLAGKTVAQLVKGLQSQKVIGDIKHYALNDQETGRNIGNVKLSKRVMRETDLLAFEISILESQPGMVMCSYNKVNGDFACENDYLLNQLLKKTWGFKGVVVSDWNATHSTAKAAMAGLDCEQPGAPAERARFGDALKKAIDAGEVPMSRVDDMVHRIIRTAFASGVVDEPPLGRVVDPFRGAESSQKIAEQSSVLLKNANALLPLDAARVQSIAIIGSKADTSVLSGGGSAQVDPPGGGASRFGGPAVWFPSSPLKAVRAKAPKAKVEFHDGVDVKAAAALAKASQLAIVFVNEPTTEGRDMPSLNLSGNQNELVSAVAAANPRTIVVLETGGPAAMPWIDSVGAAIEIWYPGVKGAEALANILFGDVNPSAKLPATFAKSDADLPHPVIFGSAPPPTPTPAAVPAAAGAAPPRFQMTPFDIDYTEGLKVGYKWFQAENKQPLFYFGHGLSYTTFAYSGLKAGIDSVTFTVRNTGKRAGAEVAQVYAGLPAAANEPPKRLVGWEKIQLAPGESKTVTVKLEPKFLSIFNEEKDDWELLAGEYRIFVGGSSADTPLTASVKR